jgi:hypothetical protein
MAGRTSLPIAFPASAVHVHRQLAANFTTLMASKSCTRPNARPVAAVSGAIAGCTRLWCNQTYLKQTAVRGGRNVNPGCYASMLEALMIEAPAEEKPLVFISHKHENSPIADAVREFVLSSTAGAVDVFQSSSEQAYSPRMGFSLNQELKTALWRAGAFILIYTHTDLDWSYCMFEYGVANNPKSPDTRIILFRCCDAVPALFAGQVNVNVRELADIQKFTNQLLTDPDFFQDHGSPVTRFQPNSGPVASAAVQFYEKLQRSLPPLKKPSHEEWPAFPFLRLRLDHKHVQMLNDAEGKVTLKKASALIQNESVVAGYDKYTERLFNSPGFENGMKFGTLVKMWKDKESRRDSKSRWIDSICKQVTASGRWQFPPQEWQMMQGVVDDTWHAPMVTRVRRVPNQYMEFDIYFFRFDIDKESASAKIGIPKV